MRFTVPVLLAMLATSAQAAFTISFEPANPTPADRIVVTIRDSSPTCPAFRARATRFIPPNEIRLEHTRVGDCGSSAPFSEAKTTIGPLPSGLYIVGLSPDSSDLSPPPGPEVTKQLLVGYPGGPNGELPYENYAGHYLTVGFSGEGVFIEQYGEKSFLTFASYDSAGQPTWYVMPDARWTHNPARGRYEFAGTVYRARRGEESPPSVHVTPIGTGAWYPTGFDTAVLETTVEGFRSKSLRRYRF